MKRIRLKVVSFICIILSLILVHQCAQATLRANYEYTIDGENIKVNSFNNRYTVRLYGIDCDAMLPGEKAEKQAKEKNKSIEQILAEGRYNRYILLEELENTKYIYLKPKGIDNQGRMVAVPYKKHLWLFNTNISKYMLKNASCKAYIQD